MLSMRRAAVPLLVTVTLLAALVEPTVWLPKAREDVLRLRVGATPAPVKLTVWGLPAALSVMVSVPVLVPEAEGIKVTLGAQFAPGFRVWPAQLLVWA